jgi:hypothetical protein
MGKFAFVQLGVLRLYSGEVKRIHNFTTRHENDVRITYEHHVRYRYPGLVTEWTSALCGESVSTKNDGVLLPESPLPANVCPECRDVFEIVLKRCAHQDERIRTYFEGPKRKREKKK